MAEIFKPSLDFNNDEALLNYIKKNPVEKIHESVPEDSTLSISDFKSRRAEDLENVFEWTLNEGEYANKTLKNFESYAGDQVIDNLRQDANTLYSGFLTANDLEKAPQEIKDSYGRILQDWENTNPEGFENVSAFYGNAKHALTDPLNLALLALTFPTSGTTAVVGAGVKTALAQKMKQAIASSSTKANVVRAGLSGGTWSGVGDSSSQAVNLAADIQKDYDATQTAVSTGLGVAIGAGAGYGLDIGARKLGNVLRSRIADKEIAKAVDEVVVDNHLRNETGAPSVQTDAISKEDAQKTNLAFADEVEDLIEAVTPSADKLKRQQRRNAAQNREAINRANLEAKEERLYGGFIPESEIKDITGEFDVSSRDLIEEIMRYEATRDVPDAADEFDDELMDVLGETYYNVKRDQRTQEEFYADFNAYMRARRQDGDKPSKELEDAALTLANRAQEAKRVDPPENVVIQAREFTANIGGGKKTEAEVADTIVQLQNGTISPDNARAVLLKTTQRFHGKWLFGKPTKFLTKFKESPTALRLAEMMRYDARDTFTSETRQVGMDYNETWKDYAGTLYSPLIKAMHSLRDISHGKAKDEVNNQLARALRGMKSSSEEINRAASTIRKEVLDEVVRRNKEVGIETNLIDENYFPRLWNRNALEKDFYGTNNLYKLRSPDSRTALAGSGDNKFARLLIEDGEAANLKEANNIIIGMLKKQGDEEGPSGSEFVAGNSFFTARKFKNIKDDNRYEDFLDNNVENMMFQYITQSANKYTKNKVFGVNSAREFETKYIDRIEEEVNLAQRGDIKAFKLKDRTDIIDLYRNMTGEGLEDFGPGAQYARDTYTLAVRMSTLPLATASSVTEALLLIHKAGTKEAATGFGKALVQGTELITNGIRRKLLKEQGLTENEVFDEMRESFLMLENAAVTAADRLGDSSLAGHGFKRVNRGFFRLIGLDGWTKTVQLAAFNTGKSIIHKNLKAIADNGTLPDSKRIGNMRDQLASLNVNVDEGIAYIKRNGGEINTKDAFYNSVKRGAGRYVNEIILDTGGRAAVKPMWMSNPKSAIFGELLGYPTAFTNKVLKEFVRSFANVKQNPEQAAHALATALTMTAAATGINYVRNPESFEDSSPGKILSEAVARWGGNGILLDMSTKASKTYDATGSYVRPVANLFGPVVGDAMTAIGYGKMTPVLGDRIPGYGAFKVFGIKDEYDEFIRDLFKEEKRMPFEKGGKVDVTSAAEEPDERIDRVTGRPYDAQAGEAFIDEEDRQERKQFILGGFVSKKLTPFVKELANTILEETKKNNVKVSQKGAIKVAEDIEADYTFEDPDMPSNLDDQDFREYLIVNTKVLLNEKHNKTLSELRDELPEYITEDNKLIGGTDFSKKRGYTDEQIADFNRTGELENELVGMPQDVNANLSYKLDTIGARTLNTDWVSKFKDIYKASAARYDNKIVSSEEMEDLIDEFTPEERRLAKKIYSKMPRQALQVDQDGRIIPIDYRVPEETRQANLEKFLAASQEKNIVYRATASGFFNEFDEAVNMPRETGMHVGTRVQAERMALFRRQKGEDIFDEDPYITPKKLSKKLSKPLKKDEDIEPIAMTRGYIQVKNPLVIKNAKFGVYSNAISFFDDEQLMQYINTAVMVQTGGKLKAKLFQAKIQNLKEKILDYEAWEDAATKGTLNEDRMSEKNKLVKKLKIADINISFRKMLEEQGFDSIKYFNAADTPSIVETEDAFSYILFKPEQFKLLNAVEFDDKDPRPNFEQGGKVLKVLNKRKVA